MKKPQVYENSPDLREYVVSRSSHFPAGWMERDKTRSMNQETFWMFEDLKMTRFWGVLSALDKDESSREWARRLFKERELEEIFELVVNQALLAPIKTTAWPGTLNGHSILYEGVVERGGSMFRECFDAEFIKRLQNGRLWEALPDMRGCLNYGTAYKRASAVLVNHSDDLDFGFVKQGFKIFGRKYDGYKRNGLWTGACDDIGFDLKGLSDTAVQQYRKFIRTIDEKRGEGGIGEEDVAKLVAPYAVEIVRDGCITYEDKKRQLNLDGSYQEPYGLLKESFLANYLKTNNFVRNAVIAEIDLHQRFGDNKERPKEIRAALDSILN